MRILIVEDNKPQLELLIKLLEEEGFEVSGCTDGVAGLYELDTGAYDLAVLDRISQCDIDRNCQPPCPLGHQPKGKSFFSYQYLLSFASCLTNDFGNHNTTQKGGHRNAMTTLTQTPCRTCGL